MSSVEQNYINQQKSDQEEILLLNEQKESSHDMVKNLNKKRTQKYKTKQQKKNKKVNDEFDSEINSQSGQDFSYNVAYEDDVYDAIKQLTKNFKFTFKDIQKSRELKILPLKDVPKDEIQNVIRKERQKISRHLGRDLDCKNLNFSQRISQKRTQISYAEVSDDEIEKREKLGVQKIKEDSQPPQLMSLSSFLLSTFNNQPLETKNKLINAISMILKSDQSLLQTSIESQVKEHIDQCYQLIIERKYKELTNILNEISPMSAIVINIQLSDRIQNLIDESRTLVITFLPYLTNCINFEFIQKESHQTLIRFIFTLVQYYLDTNETIDYGFAFFALSLSPESIQPIIKREQDMQILQKAFKKFGFNKEQSITMSKNPQKFLWKSVTNLLQNQGFTEQNDLINIFSKLTIIQNPESKLKELMDLFALRKIFTSSLIETEHINLTINQLVQVLHNLKSLETEKIAQCLKHDPLLWNKISLTYQQKDIQKANELDEQQLDQFLKQQLENIPEQKIKSKEVFFECSQSIEKSCEMYQHNQYQAAIAQVIASQKEDFIIVEMPTGSGKTWIQSILARYFINNKKLVTIIEPNNTLKIQTQELLSDVDHDLSIMTIDDFYEYPCDDEIVIVNEYDLILQNSSFRAVSNGLTGLWQLLNRKVFFFTATTNKSFEKVIKNIFQKFTVLKFKSEYELVNNISSISQGQIKTFATLENLIIKVSEDIKHFYDKKPIILFCEKEKEQQFINILQNNQLKKYIVGATLENMKEIRTWKYGVLILNPNDGIGINCKFAIDSIVLITNEIKKESQYLQTIGRSSRSRGLCESIYYVITKQSPDSIVRDMKIHLINGIQDLERLNKVLWQKRNNQTLYEIIKDAQEKGENITTLKDLQQLAGDLSFSKLMKSVRF